MLILKLVLVTFMLVMMFVLLLNQSQRIKLEKKREIIANYVLCHCVYVCVFIISEGKGLVFVLLNELMKVIKHVK
jgi:hypothetical protein